jgi:hypothetical protein
VKLLKNILFVALSTVSWGEMYKGNISTVFKDPRKRLILASERLSKKH